MYFQCFRKRGQQDIEAFIIVEVGDGAKGEIGVFRFVCQIHGTDKGGRQAVGDVLPVQSAVFGFQQAAEIFADRDARRTLLRRLQHGGALPVADEFSRVGRTVFGQHEGNARFFVNLLRQNPSVVHAVGVDDVGGAVVAHIAFEQFPSRPDPAVAVEIGQARKEIHAFVDIGRDVFFRITADAVAAVDDGGRFAAH